MSIRFPSDDNPGMSSPQAPRKRSGGSFMFMLILGVIAFMVVRSMNTAGPTPPMEGGTTSYPDLQKQPTQRVDTSDWFDQNRPSTTSQKQPQSSSNSGFGMEDVMTTPNERTSRPSTAPNAEAVTKQPVRKGDWSFDSNIETTPQPSAPKKQTNSDWGFEQVDQ